MANFVFFLLYRFGEALVAGVSGGNASNLILSVILSSSDESYYVAL